MLDLKIINSVIDQLQEERGIPRAKMLEAIESAMAAAYKKEYGKRGQIIRAKFDEGTGTLQFFQVKIVVEPDQVVMPNEEGEYPELSEDDLRIRFDAEKHIFIDDARRIKKDVELDGEIIFPLEEKDGYGRISAQSAKQVILQKIREAERASIFEEFGKKQGEVVAGIVQRMERGALYVDLGRSPAMMPYEEQIPGERYRSGERIRAYLYSVDEGLRGTFVRLSRSHPQFLKKLLELESPELASGIVEIKGIAREAGSRSKLAVTSSDSHIDPVGSIVGQRGVRVNTVVSELGGEKIDVIEWSEDPRVYITDALAPANILSVSLDEEERRAVVEVTDDQQSLAIGRGGQNVRLAAKLTGWKIDIRSLGGPEGEERIPEDDAPEAPVETAEEIIEEALEVATDSAVEEAA
jgi:N utilization substance protein A